MEKVEWEDEEEKDGADQDELLDSSSAPSSAAARGRKDGEDDGEGASPLTDMET
jgi:hypothetical protein